MAVGTIVAAKELAIGYKPMLLVTVSFSDSLINPSVLRVATSGLNSADGSFVPTITGFPHTGQSFLTRIRNQDVAATQALSEQGIDVTPTVTIELADPDKSLWTTYEKGIGSKGAELSMYFIFWNVGQNDFSSDYRTIFTGICGPAQVNERGLSVTAISRMNMNQKLLPTIRIQRRCPWTFPDTTGLTLTEATALHQQAADDPSSPFWGCGYSPLASGGNAVGNLNAGARYTSCNYTRENCIQRLGNTALVYPSFAPIEKDTTGRRTGRFGGVQWDQPSKFQSRGYGEKNTLEGFNALNEAKYNDYAPMGWGTFWVDPIVLNVVGDANFTRLEALIGIGKYKQIRKVIVNDIEIDKWSDNPAIQRQQISLQMSWRAWNTGDRNGTVNGDTIYDGTGDPYGGLTVISITIPRKLSPSSSIPRVRCLVDGAQIHKYQAITSISVTAGVATATLVGPNTDIAGNGTYPFKIVGNSKADVNGDYTSLTNWTFGPPGTIEFPTGAANGSGTGGYIQYDNFTNNPAWIILDVLTWLGWKYNQVDLDSFMSAAQFYQTSITYKNGFGATASHPRFTASLGIRQRVTGSDLIRQLRTACRSTLVPNPITGALQLLPDRTLAGQQPSAVSGSNYNTAVKSKNEAGTTTNGFVAYKFTYSSILPRNAQGESSLTLEQLPVQSAPNKISFGFTDEENGYQVDSLTLIDAEDVRRSGQEVNGQIPVAGVQNFDQARRISAWWMSRNYRGNQRKDTGGTYTFNLETSYRCVHLRVGHIVLVEYPQYGLNAGLESPIGTAINGFLARVLAIKPSVNFERVNLVLQYHDDDWYVDTFGQEDAPRYTGLRRDRLTRPSLPWLPFEQQPVSGSSLFPSTEYGFSVTQKYADSADHRPLPALIAQGKMPINGFAGKGLRPPSVALQGTTASTGGTIKGNRKLYAVVCGKNAAGELTAPSDPDTACEIDIPAGTDTNTATVPINEWNYPGVNGYEIFAGSVRNKLSNQGSGSVTDATTPSSITLTSLNEATWGVPDVEFNAMELRGKVCVHAGIIGAEVLAATSNTIQLSLFPSLQFTTNQFAPSGGDKYHVLLVGMNNGRALPLLSWEIVSNTGDTLTVSGPDCTTFDRGDGSNGLMLTDVIVITMRPTVGSDGGGNYVQDVNFVNALNPLLEEHQITGATNATPIVITTADDHGLLDGFKVLIQGVTGNTNANGVYYVDRLSATTFALYTDQSLTTPRAGNAAWDGEGIVQRQYIGLDTDQDKGYELACIRGRGEGTYYKIKSNTQDKIYIEGEWDVVPDATSIFVVNNPSWNFSVPSDTLDNSSNATAVKFEMDIPNYAGKVLFLQGFTMDGGGNEPPRGYCPWRLIWVYGQATASTGGLTAAHLTYEGTLGISSDVMPRLRPNVDIRATGARAEVKTAPTGAAVTVTIYIDTAEWMTLVIAAGTTVKTATQSQIDAAAVIPAGANIRVDIVTVGTTLPGEDLAVTIYTN